MLYPNQNYNSFITVTPDNAPVAGVVCDALYIGGAGTLALSPDLTTPAVSFTVTAGQVLPIVLRGGRVLVTGTSATGIIALQ